MSRIADAAGGRRGSRRDPGRRRDERAGGGFEGVGAILDGVLEEIGLKGRLAKQSAAEEWAACVGPRIAEVTRARGISGEALVVEVRSSAWMMELNRMRREILERINEGRGDAAIEKIVFVLGETR